MMSNLQKDFYTDGRIVFAARRRRKSKAGMA